jgi:hypothetical protein
MTANQSLLSCKTPRSTSTVGVATRKVAAEIDHAVIVTPTAGVYGVHVPLFGILTMTVGAVV